MFGKMKFIVAGLSLASIVMIAPQVRADDAPPEKKPAKKDGGGPKGDRSKMLTDELAKLNLTDDQKKKIDPIVEKLKDDMHKLMTDDSVQGDDKKKKGMEIMKAAMDEINAVLTPSSRPR